MVVGGQNGSVGVVKKKKARDADASRAPFIGIVVVAVAVDRN